MEAEPGLDVQVRKLCDEGCVLIQRGELQDAYERFSKALALVPEPREQQPLTVGIFAGLGEVYFRARSHVQAKDAFGDAMLCTGGVDRPFLHLRLGQCRLELEDFGGAVEALSRAYKEGGPALFAKEDPKYLEFLKTRRNLPAAGRWRPPSTRSRRSPIAVLLIGCKLLVTCVVLPLVANVAFQVAFVNPIFGLLYLAIPVGLIGLLWAVDNRLVAILLLIAVAGIGIWLAPTWGEDLLRCRPGTCN